MKANEHTMKTWEGVELFYRVWNAARGDARPTNKGLLLFHRGHEHSGRWEETVDRLTKQSQ